MNKLIACFSLCLLFFAGCKKDNTTTPQGTSPGCRIRSFEDGGGITTYEYDGAGNLIKTIRASGDHTTYTKGSGTLTIVEYDASGTKKSETVADINSFGFITNWKDPNGNIYKAKYDTDGYITELELTNKNNKLQYQEHYKYANGNLLRISAWRLAITTYDSAHTGYSYHYDKENKANISEYDYRPIWRFFYKPNKNLLYQKNDDFATYTYSYFLDKEGLPTQGTMLTSTGGSTFKYSFSCN